jgi:hypothetical protein
MKPHTTAVALVVWASVIAPATAGTFTACLSPGGQLSQGAIGERPLRECAGPHIEIQLQITGESPVKEHFNIQLNPDNNAFILLIVEDFAVQMICVPSVRPTPHIYLATRTAVVSREEQIRVVADPVGNPQPSQNWGSIIPQDALRTLTGHFEGEFAWFFGTFVSAVGTTMVKLQTLRRAGQLPDSPCNLRGTIEVIELPRVEVME